jgi:cysteine-S-conjugate beta-lyase
VHGNRPLKPDTILVNSGRYHGDFGGVVNPPVVRASTILYPNVGAYRSSRAMKFGTLRYGRYGTQTAFALQEAIAELEGGAGAVICPSGLAAITMVLRALLRPGDHVLVVDTVYGPTRSFCDSVLAEEGIAVTYYDPRAADLESELTPRTRVVYAESPGSLTFETQDLPSLARLCRQHGAALVADSTWATPMCSNPLRLGVDVVIHSATKYIVGHSDAMLGVAVATSEYLSRLQNHAAGHGVIAGPDDCWLALRGLRSLGVRVRQHQCCAQALTAWFSAQPQVQRILFPAWPQDPGHALWRRDFKGASGLFGIEFRATMTDHLDRFIDDLDLFGIGSSWGGFESLILPSKPVRTAGQVPQGPLVRIHAGLEDPDDLIADLERALAHTAETVTA